jgi:hypothetical protein
MWPKEDQAFPIATRRSSGTSRRLQLWPANRNFLWVRVPFRGPWMLGVLGWHRLARKYKKYASCFENA